MKQKQPFLSASICSACCFNPIYQGTAPLGSGICSSFHSFMSIPLPQAAHGNGNSASPISWEWGCWWFIWSHCLHRTAALLLLPWKSSRSMWVGDGQAIWKRCGITNGSVPFQQVGMKFIPVIGVTKSNLLAKVKAIKASRFLAYNSGTTEPSTGAFYTFRYNLKAFGNKINESWIFKDVHSN